MGDQFQCFNFYHLFHFQETRARRSQQRGYEKSARGDASVGASSGASGGATCGDDEDITQQLKGLSLYPQDENVGDGAPYVRVLNSVECRKRYLQFIGNADRKSTRLNSSHVKRSRMPSSA